MSEFENKISLPIRKVVLMTVFFLTALPGLTLAGNSYNHGYYIPYYGSHGDGHHNYNYDSNYSHHGGQYKRKGHYGRNYKRYRWHH
jgi:hypothetical protein